MKRTFLLTSLVVMAFTSFVNASYEPFITRVNATPFAGQVQEYNNAGIQGSLDAAFGTAGTGSLAVAGLTGGQAKAMQVLSDGTFLVGLSKAATDSRLVKYNAEGTVISAYGSSTGVDLGAGTLVAQTMMIDTQGRALIAGGDDTTSGTAGWLKRVSTTGTVSSFTTGTAWQFIGGLAQQTSGKIIAVGSNNTNAQIARYTLAGVLDTSGSVGVGFGTTGKIAFDGSGSLPTVTTGLYSVVVDSNDKIYVAFRASATGNGFTSGSTYVIRLLATGALDTSWHSSTAYSVLTSLASATESTIRMALDQANDLVIGATVSGAVKVTSITSAAGAAGTLANSTTSVFDTLSAVIPTSDGKVLLIGSDTVSPFNMAVMRLTSGGTLDTSTAGNNLTFNTTGYKLFNISTPDTSSILTGASVAPNGQLLAAGYQVNGGTTTPYVSRLYDAPFVSAVAQYPAVQEQGVFDTTFGSAAVTPNLQAFRGVTMPYNGNFGQLLQQQTRGIVELAAGNFLIGSDGLTGSSPVKNMMLTWLTSAGILDSGFGTAGNGKLTLTAAGAASEIMAALAVGGSGTVYVAGTVAGVTNPAVIRSYTSASTTTWTVGTAANSTSDVGIAGATTAVGLAIQGTAGILLFVQNPTTTAGHISRYDATSLALDTGFGASGYIQTGALGLNMGPVYGGGLVNRAENIIIGYKPTSTAFINVAMINKAGTALIPEFGTAGIALNVFGGVAIDPTSVRIAFDTNASENIYVAAVLSDGTQYVVTKLDGTTGAVDMSFNGGTILEVVPGASPSALTLTNLTGVSNGTVMLQGSGTFSSQPYMLTMRVKSTNIIPGGVASLDTTFNSQGATPGVAAIQIENETATYNARTITSLAVQSHAGANQGNVVYSAYESQAAAQSTPEAFRLFGATGTTQTQRFPLQDQVPGTLDISLAGVGAYAITADDSAGTGKVIYAYPSGNTYAGMILFGIDTGTDILIARVDENSLAYDVTFNPTGDVPGVLGIENLTGLENIMVDRQNRIVINGTQSGHGWVQRIPANGDSDVIVCNMPSDITAAHMVYQQKSGRYIVAGSTSSVGTTVAFQDVVVSPATGLAVDTSFNPTATTPGRYNVSGSTALYSLAINSDDTIYTAYKNTSTSLLTIAQILANGSGLSTGFGSGTGKLVTTITPDSAAVIRLVVDSSQSVIVAASCQAGTNLQAFRCNSTGGTTTEFTSGGIVSGASGSRVATTPAGVGGSAGITLRALLEDENGKTILIGSNTAGGHGQMVAARLGINGQFDTTWNPSAASTDVPGMFTFGTPGNPLTDAITIMSNAIINIEGNIFAVGGNGTNAVLMEIVGDSYVNGVAQGQLQAAAGTLDLTINPTGAGSLNLVTTGVALNAYTPNKLYIYPNGSMLIGASNGTSTTLTKVDATLALDTTFNYGAILNLGAGSATLNDMFVDNASGSDGSIYVTGASAGVVWARKVSADGLTITPCVIPSAMSAWTTGTAIRKAANGNIIVAGFDGTNGALASFFANGAALDPSFATAGPDGVYATASTNPIAAMTIDNVGRIYIAYVNSAISGSPLYVQRLTPAGVIDASFAAVPLTAATGWSTTKIKLALDIANNQLVVVGKDGGSANNVLSVARLSTVDGSGTGVAVITISGAVLNLADLFIDSNQEIYVAGYILSGTGANNSVVARLASTSATTIALDANYGTSGIANVTAGSITSIGAAGLDPDGRAYILGNSGSGATAVAYMARLFNNNYFTQVSQAVSSSTLGELDYTYGNAGVATTYANGETLPAAGQEARAIAPLTTGADILTIIGDGMDSWTVKLLPDGSNDSAYGAGIGIAIAQNATGNELVQGMVFDGSANTIVFGSNSSAGGYVKSILASGSMNPLFGGAGTNPAGTMYSSQFDVINAAAQLSDGRYVIVGSRGVVGKVGMLTSVGTIDPAFAVQSFGTNVPSVSVDGDDNIFISFASSAASIISANVAKLDATGALVRDYGTAGIVAGVMTHLDSSAKIRSVLDRDGKVVVAASGNGASGSIGLTRLNLDGSFDTSFNGGLQYDIPFAAGTSGVITSLVALQNGNYYVAGYQDGGDVVTNNDYEFVGAVTSSGALDVNFNAPGATPGLFTFQVATALQLARNIWNMNIQDNGQILLAGSESPAAGQETPLTMRINGYSGVKAIPQFIGAVPVIPTDISSTFGIAYTFPAIVTLVDGGSTAVDSQGRVLVGGITSDHTFIVARFLPNGTLDPAFSNGSNDGISQSPVLATLTTGSFISLDSHDNVYIGGITSTPTLIVAKFLATNGHLDTDGFNAGGTYGLPAGVSQSVTIPNLVSGGYSSIDLSATPGRVLLGGVTSDHKLAVARFSSLGLQSGAFNTTGVAVTPVIPTLRSGGYVATPKASLLFVSPDNSVYVGGSTYDNTLVVARFLEDGSLDTGGFNAAGTIHGIAQTASITNLADGGVVALNSDRKVIVGGFTTDKTFVAAEFLTTGVFNPAFSADGIAYSNALASLDSCVGIAINSNDSVVLGGSSTAYNGVSKSMVATRFTSNGLIDVTFGVLGLSTTGEIPGLVSGGFVAVNALNNVFAGGYDGTKLVVAGMNSGAEIFINNPLSLPRAAALINLYGNNVDRFAQFLDVPLYATLITDPTAQNSFITEVNISLAEYIALYENQPNLNLTANTTPGWDGHFVVLNALLQLAHPGSSAEIAEAFVQWNLRRLALRHALSAYSRQ